MADEPHRADCEHPTDVEITGLGSAAREFICTGCGRIRIEPWELAAG